MMAEARIRWWADAEPTTKDSSRHAGRRAAATIHRTVAARDAVGHVANPLTNIEGGPEWVQNWVHGAMATMCASKAHIATLKLVPFVEDEKLVFLKTIIPSRKATKQYLGEEPEDHEA